ncbi:hypothetical protein M413DRAFT_423938 [Hebeloma cylindrosporum]|uniref:Cell wall galactomannoprotein n=1 Tax=Hebeloma cylindrosporum TaxID=76867 RepID=A0A0C3BYG5_HEBCY|nr:hypothetical protein M413DRAFT_423938 [Hebeloma cylindrosporum h7]
MLFRPISVLVSVGLFAQAALAALMPGQVVTELGHLASLSGNVNTVLSGVTTDAGTHALTVHPQTVVKDFQTIINQINGFVTAVQATPPFSDDEASPVDDKLADVILMSTLVGKHSIFAQFALTVRIASTLRPLDSSLESLSFALIDLLPTRKDHVDEAKDKFSASTAAASTKYDQFCIPSPLYPVVAPVCGGN